MIGIDAALQLLKTRIDQEVASREDFSVREVLWCPGPYSHPINIWPLLERGRGSDLTIVSNKGEVIRVE